MEALITFVKIVGMVLLFWFCVEIVIQLIFGKKD